MSDTPAARASADDFRLFAVAALGLWILISPALVQLAGLNLPFVRPWIMFKEVGIGVLKGEFIATYTNGAEERLTPLQVLGMPRYPVARQAYRFDRLVFRDADMARFAAGFCASRAGQIADLSFKGRVGAGPGWRRIEMSDLCKETRP
jgi:hypothetical protein